MKTLVEKLLKLVTAKNGVYGRKRLLVSIAILAMLPFTVAALFESDRDFEVKKAKAFILIKKPNIKAAELDLLANTIVSQADRLQIEDGWQIDGKPVNRIALLMGMIYTESSFTKTALSKSGAIGYLQLMRPTATWLARTANIELDSKNIWHARINIAIGVTYVNMLLKEFHDIPTAMLAYNAGPGAVKRGGGIPAYWHKIHKTYREKLQLDQGFSDDNLVALK